ncbi:desulfoferrodoxin [Methanobacterium sp. MZD130B]|jgi:superoxide reductase|uniref:desulfoferrodoxin n=1 Tax=Methanobacterium sp. MZD130B TaxID=3394378 RepID=UPI0039FDC730
MTEKKEVYRCNVCGNIVTLLCTGPGELVCCKVPMELINAEQKDVGPEKHIPVIEKSENGVKVKVGEVPHPMEEGHHILWVELSTPDQLYIQFLGPDDLPEAEFPVNLTDEKEVTAKSYCNIHGFWKS